jgi:hypothetical protein
VPPPSALSYTSPQTYNVGTAITPLTPTVTGTVTSYGVTPALPAGLSLDATTGGISGTPTAPSRATHTVTATNAGGNTTFALEISVLIERATTDRPDEKTGHQVHVVYVVPSDAPDEQLDRTGTLEASARIWNKWFKAQTGGKELRLDTYDGGKLDVSFLQLARTDAQMNVQGGNVRVELEYQLLVNGFASADKAYLVYYGGDGDGCGRGAWPPTAPGNVGALYIGAAAGCTTASFATGDQPPGFLEFLTVHETLHVLGFAAACAPNHTSIGHVDDSVQDVMFSGLQAWQPSTLDVNHDDYYGPIAGCRDLANSAFLDPLPASAEAPPGWPYATLTDLGCANEITTNPGAGATAQVTFANKFTVAGAPTEITIWERTLNPTTGLYRREFRVDIPYNDGTVVMPTFVPPATEDEVYVATYLTTGGARCIGVVRATANPSRWVIEAPAAP